jgi:hypothetical protein
VNRPQAREPGLGVKGNTPHLADNGKGVNHAGLREPGLGVVGNLPRLTNGTGAVSAGLRDPGLGVWADRQHLGDNGQGVHHASAREPGLGVSADVPRLGNNGQGACSPGLREPGLGVTGNPPELVNGGRGVNRPQAREPGLGVKGNFPQLSASGGVANPGAREPGLGAGDTDEPEPFTYHPLTMPEIRRWFGYLSARLRHVRIVNGDWSRVVTSGAALTLQVRMKGTAHTGVFLDPPYGDVGRVSLYGKHEDFTVAEQVRAWALTRGDDPKWRIVYAGYDEEGAELERAGWTAVEWFRNGYLTGGMGNVAGTAADGKKGHQQHRERLWLSPHCLRPAEHVEGALW